MKFFDYSYAKRTKILTHSLIISGTLNFALIATFVTVVLKDNECQKVAKQISIDPIQKNFIDCNKILNQYLSMSYSDLIKELYDESHIEYGYRKCDLALSCLTLQHYFDIERALSGDEIEKKEYQFFDQKDSSKISLVLFPDIKVEQFEMIRKFIERELWPLTPIGIHKMLCSSDINSDSLKEALLLTPQVFAIKKQVHTSFSDDNLIELLRYTEWTDIENFSSLPYFLTSCISKGSTLAAFFLIKFEKEFALKNLDNGQMKSLLTLLNKMDSTPLVNEFLNRVSISIRSDKIEKTNVKKIDKAENKTTYTVQHGDNLWKISKMFDIDLESLRSMNDLKSDILSPGSILIVSSFED